MPGQLKEVRNRIKSVQSTQQITKAMKMVSAAKLRRAQDAITQMRPYAIKLQEMLGNIIGSVESGSAGSQLSNVRPIEKVLLITVSSDRGLCGGFNANVTKAAKARIIEKYSVQNAAGNVSIMPIGKKTYEAFVKDGYKVIDNHWQVMANANFEAVKEAATFAKNAFIDKQFDCIEIFYNQFRNAAVQDVQCEQFLPIIKTTVNTGTTAASNDFIFEPNKEVILDELLPKIINTQLFKAVLDSIAGEHGARMTAMDKATENAEEMLKGLKISYNRVRQAAITTELTEIVSGAAALNG
jgi:F-type H+-transporting ATPase subunit gamma